MRRSIPSRPWSPLYLALALAACDESTDVLGGASGASPAALTIKTGDQQETMVGWGPSAEPLVVLVTDSNGQGVPRTLVWWRIVSGSGDLCLGTGICRDSVPSSTNVQGEAGDVWFWPTEVGPIEVSARVPGLSGVVTFHLRTLGMVVGVWDWDGDGLCMDAARFVSPGGTDALTVPVGARVQWHNQLQACGHIQARIASTSGPTGVTFDSGPLDTDERFEFIPPVAGTWTYEDVYTGGTGTLIATP